MSDSSIIFINKVDPIFVAIRVLRNKLEIEQQGNSIEFENIFNGEDSFEIYLSKHKQIRENIDCISIKKEIEDDLYVKLDKGKLFQFLDVKYNNISQYSQQGAYFVNDCNQKKQDESEIETCTLFKQYIGDKLFKEYEAKKKIVVANQISTFNQYSQKYENEKGQQKEQGNKKEEDMLKKTKQNSSQRQPSKSEQKNEKAAKSSQKMDFFLKKKSTQPTYIKKRQSFKILVLQYLEIYLQILYQPTEFYYLIDIQTLRKLNLTLYQLQE